MSGDVHVRFCERLGVRFPRATHLWISLTSTPPYVVLVEQFGYELTTFELPESAPSRLSLLMLEPAPIPVEGVTVVDESALTALAERMGGRRNAYSGLVSIWVLLPFLLAASTRPDRSGSTRDSGW